MVKNKTEKNQFKQSKKKISQLRLTRLTRDPKYEISITPHKEKQNKSLNVEGWNWKEKTILKKA